MIKRVLFLASVVLLATTVSFAQTSPGHPAIPDTSQYGEDETNAYGTGRTATWIPASAFIARGGDQSKLVHAGDGFIRANASLNDLIWAPVNIPSGALIDVIRFFYYDTSASDMMFWYTRIGAGDTDYQDLKNGVSTGNTGYGNVDIMDTTYTVDNFTNAYVVYASLPSDASNLRLKGVRILWTRQVSPAPAVASFLDVPTSSPIFKFVEALAAAGITGGCGGGNYCPSSPVTRGQMAVFIAQALGLHWPD